MNSWLRILLAALIFSVGQSAMAATGPTQSPLKVVTMYLTGSTTLYVQFQVGAMPGCYGTAGGYLWFSHAHFEVRA